MKQGINLTGTKTLQPTFIFEMSCPKNIKVNRIDVFSSNVKQSRSKGLLIPNCIPSISFDQRANYIKTLHESDGIYIEKIKIRRFLANPKQSKSQIAKNILSIFDAEVITVVQKRINGMVMQTPIIPPRNMIFKSEFYSGNNHIYEASTNPTEKERSEIIKFAKNFLLCESIIDCTNHGFNGINLNQLLELIITNHSGFKTEVYIYTNKL